MTRPLLSGSSSHTASRCSRSRSNRTSGIRSALGRPDLPRPCAHVTRIARLCAHGLDIAGFFDEAGAILRRSVPFEGLLMKKSPIAGIKLIIEIPFVPMADHRDDEHAGRSSIPMEAWRACDTFSHYVERFQNSPPIWRPAATAASSGRYGVRRLERHAGAGPRRAQPTGGLRTGAAHAGEARAKGDCSCRSARAKPPRSTRSPGPWPSSGRRTG